MEASFRSFENTIDPVLPAAPVTATRIAMLGQRSIKAAMIAGVWNICAADKVSAVC